MLTWKDIAEVEQQMRKENLAFASLEEQLTRKAALLNERLAFREEQVQDMKSKRRPNCF